MNFFVIADGLQKGFCWPDFSEKGWPEGKLHALSPLQTFVICQLSSSSNPIQLSKKQRDGLRGKLHAEDNYSIHFLFLLDVFLLLHCCRHQKSGWSMVSWKAGPSWRKGMSRLLRSLCLRDHYQDVYTLFHPHFLFERQSGFICLFNCHRLDMLSFCYFY